MSTEETDEAAAGAEEGDCADAEDAPSGHGQVFSVPLAVKCGPGNGESAEVNMEPSRKLTPMVTKRRGPCIVKTVTYVAALYTLTSLYKLPFNELRNDF